MKRTQRLVGAAALAATAAVVAVWAGIGSAAAAAEPRNTQRPTIAGEPVEGRVLIGDNGSWANGVDDYDYFWLRCNKNGEKCNTIDGANDREYRLRAADIGHTIRFRVRAENKDGRTTASSVPTAVVRKAEAAPPPPPPPPSRGAGCPTGASPDPVAGIAPPARLNIDKVEAEPDVIPGSIQAFVVRFHVTSTCGGDVRDALVYATAVPYNMLSTPPETATGSDGWVELRFSDINFPITPQQQLLVIFVRARKPGESLLGGISTRRLVSVRVNAGA